VFLAFLRTDLVTVSECDGRLVLTIFMKAITTDSARSGLPGIHHNLQQRRYRW
jgi:hypothetical protein